MGYYINVDSKGNPLPATGKARALIQDGAVSISSPDEFQPNLVCVVLNGPFDAAAFAYSNEEYEYFLTVPGDTRTKQWLLYEHAAELSGYNKDHK